MDTDQLRELCNIYSIDYAFLHVLQLSSQIYSLDTIKINKIVSSGDMQQKMNLKLQLWFYGLILTIR